MGSWWKGRILANLGCALWVVNVSFDLCLLIGMFEGCECHAGWQEVEIEEVEIAIRGAFIVSRTFMSVVARGVCFTHAATGSLI